jgi:hypothetical protein
LKRDEVFVSFDEAMMYMHDLKMDTNDKLLQTY